MRKRDLLDVFFVSMFFLSILMIDVGKVQAATTQVSVQPQSRTVGEEGVVLPTPSFAINITVQNVEDLKVWQVVLYHNSTILNTRPDLIRIPSENIFKDRQYSSFGPYIESDSNGKYLYFGASLLGGQSGVTGSGVLFQINFTGQVAGSSELNLGITTQHDLYTYLLNSSFEEMSISTVDGQVTVIGTENPREPSTITIGANPSTITVGSNVTITGTINPPTAGANVTIYYTLVLGTPGTLATKRTDEFGRYEYNWTTEETGEYDLYAYWPGDANYQEATSNITAVTVNKQISIHSLTVHPQKVIVGSNVTISGTIITLKPTLPYEKVTILYKQAGENWTTLATVYPGDDGAYTYTWKTDKEGIYELRASWPGDKYSESADSNIPTVEVTGEGSGVMVYLYYIIAAVAIITSVTIGFYFIRIRKHRHAIRGIR